MATSPVNHQRSETHNPLHNFSLLKWGNKSHANSLHRTRRPTDSPTSADYDRRVVRRRSPTSSPLESREAVCDVSGLTGEEGGGFERRSVQIARKRFDFEEKRIRIEDGGVDEMDEEAAEAEGRAEELRKLWNLRPRKTPASKNGRQIGVNGGAGGSVGASSKVVADFYINNGGDTVTMNDANAAPKSLRLRGLVDGGVEKKERAKLWISLSKEEIEEDIFVLTGSRPARRPKRRSRAVQKNLDIVFPGLSLLGATAESFKIIDSPPKK